MLIYVFARFIQHIFTAYRPVFHSDFSALFVQIVLKCFVPGRMHMVKEYANKRKGGVYERRKEEGRLMNG
jgi:hypothetical protein